MEASKERVLQASYNTSSGQLARHMIKNRSDNVVSDPSAWSAESSGPPVTVGSTQVMVQLRAQTQNLTRSTVAFPQLGPEKQRRKADGSPPTGGQETPPS